MGGPQENWASVLMEVGRISTEQRPVPAVGSHSVLVEVEAVGICGSDVHYFRHGRIGSYVVESPLILGHETAGTVVQIGDAVRRVSVGDRVAIEPGRTCGECAQCRAGHYNLCEAVEFHGTPPFDGTLQQYVAVDESLAFKLPDTVSVDEGAMVEPLAVAVWACRAAGVSAGDRVLVTGAGPVGLLALQTARAFGAARVVITDLDTAKGNLAKRLGADEFLDAASPDGIPGRYDIHIECSGSVIAALAGIQQLAPRGVSVLVGMGDARDLKIPVSLIQERELMVTGIFRYANCFPTAIELLASRRVQVEDLISGRFGLGDASQALEASSQAGTIKCLVLPQR